MSWILIVWWTANSAATPLIEQKFTTFDNCDKAGKSLVRDDGEKPFAYTCSRNIGE